MNQPIYLVVATDEQNGIGINSKLPWHFKKEMQFFAELTKKTADPTKKNVVIMGRKTWESLPEKYRPLPERRNIILTSQGNYIAPGAEVAESLDAALQLADDAIETIFIIGGAKVYEETINQPNLTGVYLTKIHQTYNCDTFFPEIPEEFSQKNSLGKEIENDVHFEYWLYTK